MDEKWIVIIGIIILLVVGFFVFTNFMNQATEFKVGDAKFKVPDGYHVESSKKKMANLTDGKKNICIREYDDKNIKKHIDSYINQSEKNNKTVKISNFTVGKILVYKSNLNKSNSVHYWFVKNNKAYTIYSADKNPEFDSITAKLIKSVH
ncbi:MAG: hypothetical protein E7Z73_08055 [Methanobrevibacter millerae]|uniref:Uncharacterized protein n=1 Tax=Methanobrevibacter millerae TaxID=230361 RepID=A0A8T3VEQ5_9EURY|nr:hypothetical protein [Methanobrevibacter millerae]MBE6505672.1 hypothetical protein [Methanobrevibacter millerae]